MPFCNKCGTRIEIDDIFCPECGARVGGADASYSPAPSVAEFSEDQSEPLTPASPIPSMTKEESIELAEKLKKEYNNLEKIQKEIDENQEIISKPVTPAKRHSAFKYFWPYLVSSVIVGNAGWITGLFVVAATRSGELYSTFAVGGVVLAIVLIIIGAVTSKSRRNELNANAQRAERDRHRRQQVLTEKNKELRTRYTSTKKRLEQYNGIVPREYRDARHMDRVRILLQTGKAENFAEAIKNL